MSMDSQRVLKQLKRFDVKFANEKGLAVMYNAMPSIDTSKITDDYALKLVQYYKETTKITPILYIAEDRQYITVEAEYFGGISLSKKIKKNCGIEIDVLETLINDWIRENDKVAEQLKQIQDYLEMLITWEHI
jgi:NADH:ubiquinone oxidoreductase subunit D